MANAYIYTGTEIRFNTFCKVKYPYAGLILNEECEILVNMSEGRIEIHGNRINSDDVLTKFSYVVDVFKFIDNTLVITGSYQNFYSIEIGEYAPNCLMKPS